MLMLFGILILLVDMTMRKLARSPSHVCLTNFTKTVTLLEDEKAAECDSRLSGDNERHSSLASPYQILYIFGPGVIWLFKSYVKSIVSL